MAEVSLELDDLSAPELLATGNRLVEGLQSNANFPTPKPTVDQLKERIQKLATAQEEYRRERQRLNELKTARDAAMRELKAALQAEAEYVQEASQGDAKKILSANLCAERRWSLWPFHSLGQVIELSATNADAPGEVDLVWDPVRGADGYEVDCTTDAGAEEDWEQCAVSSESRVTVKGLIPRRRYWFRVRAVGGKGEGEWSDPITKYAR